MQGITKKGKKERGKLKKTNKNRQNKNRKKRIVTSFLTIIIESFELEGILKSHLAQLPCNEQGHPQLDQVAQSLVQSDLECLQGGGIHHLSGQSVPVPHHRYCKI